MVYKYPEETNESFIERVLQAKINCDTDMTWKEIAFFIASQTGVDKDESTWRKRAKKNQDMDSYKDSFEDAQLSMFDEEKLDESDEAEEIKNLIREFKIERYKLSDIRTQDNAYLRRIAREQTILEIAKEAAKEISKNIQLPFIKASAIPDSEEEAILELSDWHYGIEIDNYWNKFNTKICRQRVNKLKEIVVHECHRFGITRLHIVNLSDLIAGRIHSSIRYESRCDVITQTITVAEILAEFMAYLYSQGIHIEYYDCLDNHSRLEPIKADSLDLESLVRVIPWFLKERLSIYEGININSNTYDEDIIDFNVLGYRIAGVHGHKDKPNKVVEGLTLMTKEHFDLILTAHYHHFSCDERNETLVISNGSLMGTDTYAKNLRLCSKPSQNLIIVSNESVADYIKRIPLA